MTERAYDLIAINWTSLNTDSFESIICIKGFDIGTT